MGLTSGQGEHAHRVDRTTRDPSHDLRGRMEEQGCRLEERKPRTEGSGPRAAGSLTGDVRAGEAFPGLRNY